MRTQSPTLTAESRLRPHREWPWRALTIVTAVGVVALTLIRDIGDGWSAAARWVVAGACLIFLTLSVDALHRRYKLTRVAEPELRSVWLEKSLTEVSDNDLLQVRVRDDHEVWEALHQTASQERAEGLRPAETRWLVAQAVGWALALALVSLGVSVTALPLPAALVTILALAGGAVAAYRIQDVDRRFSVVSSAPYLS